MGIDSETQLNQLNQLNRNQNQSKPKPKSGEYNMSTVDLETAKLIVKGKYKGDGYKTIIIYGNMFGGISFKLCKANQAPIFMDQFRQNGWPHELIWGEPIGMETFMHSVETFQKNNPDYTILIN